MERGENCAEGNFTSGQTVALKPTKGGIVVGGSAITRKIVRGACFVNVAGDL
jgi:hypothetical protein